LATAAKGPAVQPLLFLLAFSFMLGLGFRRASLWQFALLALAAIGTAAALYARTGYM